MIAPLVLGFAFLGISLFYLAYRYNVLFVTDSKIDTKGLIYPRALQHLTTGVYLAQVCMIGLFGISESFGPLVITIIGLILTVLFHISMNSALGPLMYNLPKSLEIEEESFRPDHNVAVGKDPHPQGPTGEAGDPEKRLPDVPPAHKAPSMLMKFFKPHIYSDYATLRRLVPHDIVDADNLYNQEIATEAYLPPTVKKDVPLVWIPRDPLGISHQEVRDCMRVIPATDEGAQMDENGKISWEAQDNEGRRPPIWEEKIYY